MKYQSQVNVNVGAWVDKTTLETGTTAKIVSETKPSPSNFKDRDGNPQTQDVCKVLFGNSTEAVNVGLNKPTIAGLMHAFGDDSINWQGHQLTVETEKMRIAGRAVIALYLIPEGYKRIDDENGYAVIVPVPKVGGTDVVYPEANETNTPKKF